VLSAGIDVGSHSAKAVIFDGRSPLGRQALVSDDGAETAARNVFRLVLEALDLKEGAINSITATGWGRRRVSFADRVSSELVCASRGARWLAPGAGTVVDIGAEGCRAMRLKADGTVEESVENSKCASGTGAFIELAATYLKVPVDRIGQLALAGSGRADISSTCAVFAESAIISQIHRGESVERIAAGIVWSVATRVTEVIQRVGVNGELVLVGGGALNQALVRTIGEMAGLRPVVPDQPQFVAALGAAIQAQQPRQAGVTGWETRKGG
jgi:predicted CoA-substrate-specific enzyme activase